MSEGDTTWVWEPLEAEPLPPEPTAHFETWAALSAQVQAQGAVLTKMGTQAHERDVMQREQETAWTDMIGVLQRHTEALVALTDSNRELGKELREQREWLMRLKLTISEMVSALERDR